MTQAKKKLPVAWLIPNIVTIMGLCSGLTAIKFALHEKWEMAYWFIIAAILIDAMDGRLARLLKSSSTFGAQLDSLCDFVSFGVVPGIVTYLWTLQDFRGFGWGVVLFFAVCCALRLARFNTTLFDSHDVNADKYFMGVPAPVGAGLGIFPMVLYFQFGNLAFIDNTVVALNMAFVGFLMASRIPTISLKKMSISVDMVLIAMLAAGLFIAMLIIEPWYTIMALTALYYITIPMGFLQRSKVQTSKK